VGTFHIVVVRLDQRTLASDQEPESILSDSKSGILVDLYSYNPPRQVHQQFCRGIYHHIFPKAAKWAAFSSSSVLRLQDFYSSFSVHSESDRIHALCAGKPEAFVKLSRWFVTGTLLYCRPGSLDEPGGLESRSTLILLGTSSV
jgi:hypothetical protein